MSESKVFRGSWIPAKDTEYNMIWSCPVCGETVYMAAGSPTYPTCPWCLTDMPESEDFETPEELREMKRHNKAVTDHVYSCNPADNQRKNERQRERYRLNAETERAKKREHYALNRDQISEHTREYLIAHPDKAQARRERSRQYREDHKEEINARRRQKYAENPEKYKEQARQSRIRNSGRPMREVMAHIYGVPVEDIPKNKLHYGKGRQPNESD